LRRLGRFWKVPELNLNFEEIWAFLRQWATLT
jgi:hypothetical protein